MTYGQVAALLGVPRAARAVGWTLHWVQGDEVPCQRVVNRFGGLAAGFGWGGQVTHKALLVAEGVQVREDFTVDLEIYQWWPDKSELPNLELSVYAQNELDQQIPEAEVRLSHRKLKRK